MREKDRDLTDEGKLIVALSKALFAKDADSAFRKLGEHMDKAGLKVSKAVCAEFRNAGRIL